MSLYHHHHHICIPLLLVSNGSFIIVLIFFLISLHPNIHSGSHKIETAETFFQSTLKVSSIMDKCNLHFHKIIVVLLLIMIYWLKLSICWKLDNDNVMYMNQDILYNCPLNTMCRCFPNETKLLEISCNEVSLFKFPGKY